MATTLCNTDCRDTKQFPVCMICNSILSSDISYLEHKKSIKHRKSYELYTENKFVLNENTKDYECVLCHITCANKVSYKKHCNGSKHIKALELLNNIESLNLRLYATSEKAVAQAGVEEMSLNDENTGSSEDAVVTTDFTTTLSSATAIKSQPTIIKSTLSPMDMNFPNGTFIDYMSKPIKYGVFTFDTTKKVNDYLFSGLIPGDLFKLAQQSAHYNAIRTHAYIRAGVKYRFVVTGNRFAQGQLIAYAVPPCEGWQLTYYNMTARAATNLQYNALLGVAEAGVYEIEVPFILKDVDYLPITDPEDGESLPDPRYLHEFRLQVLNPLVVGTGAPTKVSVAMWVSFFDVELKVLTELQSPRFSLIADRRNYDKPYLQGFDLTSIVGGLGPLIGGLGQIFEPIVSTASDIIDGTTQVIDGGIKVGSSIFGLFGLDKPNAVDNKTNTVIGVNNTWVHARNYETAPKFAFNPTTFAAPPLHKAISSHAPSLEELVQTPGLVWTVDWKTSDPEGTQLLSAVVTPLVLDTQRLTPNIINSNYVGTWLINNAPYYEFWSGSIEYGIQPICTDMHRGQLSIVHIPTNRGYTATYSYDQLSNYTIQTIDLKPNEITWFSCDQINSLPLVRMATINPEVSGSTPDVLSYSNGVVKLHVVNTLTGPSNVATTIQVNVWMRAGKNFTLAVPLQPSQTWVQAGVEETMCSSLENTHIGETHMNLIDLAKRPSPVGSTVISFQDILDFTTLEEAATNNYCLLFPVDSIITSRVLKSDTLSASKYGSFLQHVSNQFAYNRGSVRIKAIMRFTNSVTLPQWSSKLTYGWNPHPSGSRVMSISYLNVEVENNVCGMGVAPIQSCAGLALEWDIPWMQRVHYALNPATTLRGLQGSMDGSRGNLWINIGSPGIEWKFADGITEDTPVCILDWYVAAGDDYAVSVPFLPPRQFPNISDERTRWTYLNRSSTSLYSSDPIGMYKSPSSFKVEKSNFQNGDSTSLPRAQAGENENGIIGFIKHPIKSIKKEIRNTSSKLTQPIIEGVAENVKNEFSDKITELTNQLKEQIPELAMELGSIALHITNLVMSETVLEFFQHLTHIIIGTTIGRLSAGFVTTQIKKLTEIVTSAIEVRQHAVAQGGDELTIVSSIAGIVITTITAIFTGKAMLSKHIQSVTGQVLHGFVGASRFFTALKTVPSTIEWFGTLFMHVWEKLPFVSTPKSLALDDENLGEKAIDWLERTEHFLLDMCNNELVPDCRFIDLIGNLIDEGEKYRRYCATCPQKHARIYGTINATLKHLRDAHKEIILSMGQSGFRIDPYCISLFGDKGSGKSTIGIKLINDLAYIYDIPEFNRIYSRNEMDAYWSRYAKQPFVYIDDFFANTQSESLKEFITLKSGVAMFLNMAAIEEKGIEFASKFVLMTTNTPYPKPTEIVCVDALWRRRNILIEVKRSAQLDPTKYQNDVTEGVKFYLHDPLDPNALPSKEMTYDELLTYLTRQANTYHRTQQLIMENINTHSRNAESFVSNNNEEVTNMRQLFSSFSSENRVESILTRARAHAGEDVDEFFDTESVEESAYRQSQEMKDLLSLIDPVLLNVSRKSSDLAFVHLTDVVSKLSQADIDLSRKQVMDVIRNSTSALDIGKLFEEHTLYRNKCNQLRTSSMLQVICNQLAANFINKRNDYMLNLQRVHDVIENYNTNLTVEVDTIHEERLPPLYALTEELEPRDEEFSVEVQSCIEYHKSIYELSGASSWADYWKTETHLLEVYKNQNQPRVIKWRLGDKYKQFCSALRNAINKFKEVCVNIWSTIKAHPFATVIPFLSMSIGIGWLVYKRSTAKAEKQFASMQSAYTNPGDKGLLRPVRPIAVANGKIDPNMDIIQESVVQPNLVRASFANYDQTKSYSCQIFGLQGSLFLVNKHMVQMAHEANKDSNNRNIFVAFRKENQIFKSIINIDSDIAYAPEGRDIAVMRFGVRAPPMRRIVHHFVRQQDLTFLPRFQGKLIHRQANDELEFLTGESVAQDSVEAIRTAGKNGTETKEVCFRHMYCYKGVTKPGTCGAMLVHGSTKINAKIIGIHSACASASGLCYASTVDRDTLEKLISKLDKFDVIGADRELATLQGETNVRPEGKFIIEGKVAKNMRPSRGSKTSFELTPIAGLAFDVTTRPPLTKPERKTLSFDPFVKAISKYGKDTGNFPYKQYNLAEQQVIAEVMCKVKPLRKNVGVLSVQESVLGFPELEYYDAINKQSSPGYPYILEHNAQPGKLGYLNFETGDIRSDVRSELEEKLRLAKQGIRKESIWVDCEKDARLPIEKVEQGKLRVFTISPLVYTIMSRMYCLDFCAAFYSAHVDFFSAVGIDVHSPKWSELYHKLRERSATGFAGDYSAWDGTILPEAIQSFTNVMNAWYNDSEENQRVRHVLMNELIHTMQIADDCLYNTVQGNPSGNPMTTVMNTIVNAIYLQTAFYCLAPQKYQNSREYARLVKAFFYGDDNIVAVSEEAQSFFNLETCAKFFEEYGIVYGDAMKSGNASSECVPIKELTFLKRGFRPDARASHVVHPIIDKQTITELVNWIKKSPDSNAMLRSNFMDACAFAYHWDKQYYEHFVSQVMPHLQRLMDVECPSFASFDIEHLGKYGMGDSTGGLGIKSQYESAGYDIFNLFNL